MSLAASVNPPGQAGRPPAGVGLLPVFAVPARHNERLRQVVQRLAADDELRHLWQCAHLNAVERLGLGGSGEVHARIVANAALRLLRLLAEAGQVPGVTAQHGLPREDAEVVVVLAAALHDLGLAVSPADPGPAGLMLAREKAPPVLAGLYPASTATVLAAETLQVISSQPAPRRCLTLEASVLRLADVLDLAKGRPPGQAAAEPPPVAEVVFEPAERPGVRVSLQLASASRLPALEAYLAAQLRGVTLAPLVEISARRPGRGHREPVRLAVWSDTL